MPASFQPVFERLRELLQRHAARYTIHKDEPAHFGLAAPVGPATIQVWGGKVKSKIVPVAWVQIGKGYVSFHLMGVYSHPKLLDGCSKELRARMQGKSCFNFKAIDEPLFAELGGLAAKSMQVMRDGGYIL